MFSSLKSKYIISFVTIQLIFFALIIGINFNSIDKASKKSTDEKVQISNQLLNELLITPMIVYDLATIDDIASNFSSIENVVAIIVEDRNDVILSSHLKENAISGDLIKDIHSSDALEIHQAENPNYVFSSVRIDAEGEFLGHIHFILDSADSIKAVEKNQRITYLLVLLGLISGLITSFIIGNKLGKSLKNLTKIAKDVADDKEVIIPHNNHYNDEIGELFNAMHQMQSHISERTKKLNNSINDLQQFMNALNQSAIVSKTDIRGIITYVNDMFCEVTGYSKDELLGKTHSIIKDPAASEDFFKEMWETIMAKKIFHSTFKNIKKNGESYYVDATIVPLLDNSGNIVEYIAIRYEVTEIMDAKNKALEAKKAKENFLSNMSHEIRTPMNAIFGFAQMAQKNTTDEKNLSYLKTIQNSSQTLLHIINDILDFSKIESGKLSIENHPFNPKSELCQTIEIFSLSAKERSINLVTNIDDNVPECLEGDLIRIKQIMFNFISNALKFTPENKNIVIDIAYKRETKLFSIEVKDEGIGISREEQGKIFNVFEQADNSTTRKFGGTGLGLAISSNLAALMNGQIILKSTEGVGSSFKLLIPLEACTLDNKDFSLSDSADEAPQDTKKFTGKVLVAEDNRTNQMLITMLLDDYGLEYTVANDGLEAVEAFKASKFCLVLMDESMPNMTGLEAFEKIRQYEDENQLTHTPVVPLTANVMQEYRERFIDAGMDDFLAKPIDNSELERVLERFLKVSDS